LRESCAAETENLEQGAHEFTFSPTRRPQGISGVLASPHELSPGRGANALIVANALIPVLARTGMYSSFSLRGETYGQNALSFDYFQLVTLPVLARAGLHVGVELMQAGFGRESRGEIALDVEPSALTPIVWSERGDLMDCRAVISHSQIPVQTVHRGAAHLTNLAKGAKLGMEIDVQAVASDVPGIYITLFARFERGMGGATIMGLKGVRVESLAQGLFEDFWYWLRSNATVDSHLADQVLLTLCQAEGDSHFTVSQVTKRFLTTVWVVKQFMPIPITVKGKEGEKGTVTIRR
jgi:RNA 3'-terminal phosphate cyclase (ATP)